MEQARHASGAKERRCILSLSCLEIIRVHKDKLQINKPRCSTMPSTAGKGRLLVCHGDGEGGDSDGGWKETGCQQHLRRPG